MDFSWTNDQNMLYNTILHSLQKDSGDKEPQHNSFWTRSQWERCGELGLLGLCVPEQYQGRGLGALDTSHAVEAFGRGCTDMGLVFSAAAHLFAATMPIAEYGNEKTKEKFLPGLCSGKLIGANAITEKESGSDVFALKTAAVKDGQSYILMGTKSFVSNGPVADLFVVYALTNPAHGYLGITAFVIEKGTPGLHVGEPLQKIGLTSTPASQLTLDQCRVPLSNRLGQEGQGSQIFKQSMQWERACLFASYLGQMERQLEVSVNYAKTRRQFGKPIGKNQAIAHRLANMKLRLESARLLLYRACWRFDHNEDAMQDISLAKLAISEAAIQGGLDAIRIHGSAGIDVEAGIEVMLRDALPSIIFSGTTEMQQNIIANSLGL
ncbi:acyl-CoA dehydrogenase family protein [Dictyobacter formicarum]|uniref:Acyl-CoA dehydrogenase n=1 Tax=Dictyobacter formicarum TaxID=2778368 RepID=A0ABQ3V9W9_9CHLR|nr:acyl-CoA dehydrogenase family protein [Dictyobacter formicarum]GHO82463.1 acyl-CoA dehydrogenase [Dictyobacter formicarum]